MNRSQRACTRGVYAAVASCAAALILAGCGSAGTSAAQLQGTVGLWGGPAVPQNSCGMAACGDPGAGQWVVVVGHGQTYTAKSDSQGHFVIKLPAGDYLVRSCGGKPVPTALVRGRVSHVDLACSIP